jgi:hypothetical protein
MSECPKFDLRLIWSYICEKLFKIAQTPTEHSWRRTAGAWKTTTEAAADLHAF